MLPGFLRGRPRTAGTRILRVLVFAGPVVTGVLVGFLVMNRGRQSETACANLIADRARVAAAEFERTFLPLRRHLLVLRDIGRKDGFDPADPEGLRRVLIPVLQPVVIASSVVVAGPAGREHRLVRTGPDRRLAVAVGADPANRSEAWFTAALDAIEEGRVCWTDPSGNGAGATASVAFGDGWVVAMTIPPAAIREFVERLPLGRSGEFYVSSGENSALGFRREGDDPVRTLESDELLLGLAPGPMVLEGEVWWWAPHPVEIGDREFRTAIVVSEAELLAPYQEGETAILVVFGAIILAGAVSAGLLVRATRGEPGRPRHSEASEAELLALIGEGEQDHLEFKSTMRFNLKAGKPTKEISISWLKTVAAFLNSEGGTLLIGVEDDGGILGTGPDNFKNDDLYLLHVNNLLNDHIGAEHVPKIAFALREVSEKKILVVDCGRSPDPVFLSVGETEEFYVRVGPGSRKLPTSKAMAYIKRR